MGTCTIKYPDSTIISFPYVPSLASLAPKLNAQDLKNFYGGVSEADITDSIEIPILIPIPNPVPLPLPTPVPIPSLVF